VNEIKPKTVLDVGVGWGTFGVIVREKTDVVEGRWQKKDWEVVIRGIEVWQAYITMPHVEYIYDELHHGNIVEYCSEIEREKEHWDLIHAGDVIEHVVKEEGREVLRWMMDHCRNLILQIPLGDGWASHAPDPEIWKNPWEAHKAAWYLHEFSGWCDAVNLPTSFGAVLCAWWKFE
jgi:hypothetical protein